MEKYIILEKKISQTPLECIKEFREENPNLASVKISYAGRLDPLAKGKLLVLLGKENKNRIKYENFSKEYVFKVLPFFSTGSSDLLGLVEKTEFSLDIVEDLNELEATLKSFCKKYQGIVTQAIPKFSSYRIKGKPLFYWARKGIEVDIPSRNLEIFDFKYLGKEEIEIERLKAEIINRISKVKGDFRQDEVIKTWESSFEELTSQALFQRNHKIIKTLPILSFRIKVQSGFYVRSLTKEFTNLLKIPTVIYEIDRTEIFIT